MDVSVSIFIIIRECSCITTCGPANYQSKIFFLFCSKSLPSNQMSTYITGKYDLTHSADKMCITRLTFSFVYIFVYLFTCLFIYMFIYLFTCLFICLHVCLFVYMFVYLLFICLHVYLFVNMFVYLFTYLFTCLFTCLHVCLFVYMFVYLFTADVGGFMGLWLGASILTVLEFIDFVAASCRACCKQKQKQRKTVDVTEKKK